MKVKELIEHLQKVDQDLEVCVYVDEEEAAGKLNKVKVIKNENPNDLDEKEFEKLDEKGELNNYIPYVKGDFPKFDGKEILLLRGR